MGLGLGLGLGLREDEGEGEGQGEGEGEGESEGEGKGEGEGEGEGEAEAEGDRSGRVTLWPSSLISLVCRKPFLAYLVRGRGREALLGVLLDALLVQLDLVPQLLVLLLEVRLRLLQLVRLLHL